MYTLIVCSALTASTVAGQVANGGFEDWTDFGTYEDPDGWITQNQTSAPLGAALCEKGSPGDPGSFYIKLTTKDVPFIGVLPAFVTSGHNDGANSTFGFPANTRPAALTGNWQHLDAAADSGMITIAFSKWNPITHQRDGIGAGVRMIGGTASSWESFSIPIQYGSPEIPDTAVIFMYSSTSQTPNVGNYLYVDNLAFSDVSGTEETPEPSGLVMRPTLAETSVSLSAPGAMEQVTVWDARGNKVLSKGLASTAHTMDVSAWPGGIYVVEVRLADATMARQRFMKL